ncbi:MAG: sugar phosphate nucleotidyltransferase [Candidatus Margulisbacteria bacterium]|nr:sugar phosphate nucleotidyltransferase [Candidatus Margulisiibacteriota bacterium]
MKGIILAGGTGSRLYPLTKVTNKHLLPVGKEPMIYHPIRKLVGAGIEEILIVTGIDHMGDIVNLLGSGREFDCCFTYKVQDQAGGIAQALALAETFVGGDRVMVILGDNIFQDDLAPFADKFRKQKQGAKILLKEVADPHRFGVAEIKGNKVVSIAEKPKKPKSNLSVTGVYFYDHQVFDIVRKLKPSARGELEISDVNQAYLRNGSLTFDVLSGWWSDAGTFESLAKASLLVEGKIKL